LFPDELSEATKPFRDLVAGEIRAAADRGLLRPSDPTRDPWLIEQLVMAVYHYNAYASTKDEGIGEALWQFCLAALGGSPALAAERPDGAR
jgi:TetR/AcrR family transcriptional regulator